MREVAEKVGYSPTSIYLHFKDKHEMLREVVLYGFQDFAESSARGPWDRRRSTSCASAPTVIWYGASTIPACTS